MKLLHYFRYIKRYQRYFFTALKRLTFKRLANLILVEYEFLRKQGKVKGMPYELIVETTNMCQLKCPLCSTGLGKSGRTKGQMSFSLFKEVIDEFSPFAFHLFLQSRGEPFLSNDICRFIQYAHQANMEITISSNLSMELDEQKIADIISSGLDTLVISLDGIDAETYNVYRQGGNFEKVLENIRSFVKLKKIMHSRTPLLEWQYLVMKQNEQQIDEARELAKKLEVDSIFFGKIVLPHNENDPILAERWLPVNDYYRHKMFDKPDDLRGGCWWLWRMAAIAWDGGVSPCCYIDDQRTDFGRFERPFKRVWNNQNFRSARSLFKKYNFDADIVTVCRSCNVARGEGN